jgi:LuxR family transcriptional regulator, maltose regulon positive regulatory protein
MAQLHAKQLIVIKAGVGFGKTSLAVAWEEQLQRSGHGVAWLALDADDDEPSRFLLYMSHALRRACRGIGEAAINQISDIFLAPPKAIVATPVNELADIEVEVFLLVED